MVLRGGNMAENGDIIQNMMKVFLCNYVTNIRVKCWQVIEGYDM